MKFSYENTAGTAFPLRDKTDFKLKVPPISLTKGVKQVDSGTVHGPNYDNNSIDGGGHDVTYRVDVTNPGTDDLTGRPRLGQAADQPDPTCSDVDGASISDGGACDSADNIVKWPGLSLAAGRDEDADLHGPLPARA